MTLRIDWLGERLSLLPERAIHWERARTLLIADPHLGKAAAFRAAGAPVPEATTGADLARLASLVQRTRAEHLVILGDLLHARAGRTLIAMSAFEAWRTLHRTLEITLIRGNHDRASGDPPGAWRIRVSDGPLAAPPFAFIHEPAPVPRAYALAGHLHPAVRLTGAGGSMRPACFWFRESLAVLPAFGGFTGARRIDPAPGDRVFAVGAGEVIEIALLGAQRPAGRTGLRGSGNGRGGTGRIRRAGRTKSTA